MAKYTIYNAKELGAAIKERRTMLGLDQATLAQKVGVSRQWIVEIEKGKPRASVELALRTLSVLGIQFTSSDSNSAQNDLDDVFDDLTRQDA